MNTAMHPTYGSLIEMVENGAPITALNRWFQRRARVDARRDRELRELRARVSKLECAFKRRAS